MSQKTILMIKQKDEIAVLIIAFLFYCLTLAPTIIGGDSSQLAINVAQLNLHFGNASDHPLYIIIGRLFSLLPFELAYSMNIMSAFFGAFSIMLIYLIIKKISGSHFPAAFGALSLMVSHTFWQHSVIAEVYTLHGFFLSLLIYLTVIKSENRFIKYSVPFIFLIGTCNHLILVTTIPAFIYYILANSTSDIRKKVVIIGASFVVLFLFIIGFFYLMEAYYLKRILRRILLGPPPILHYLFLPDDLNTFLKECLFYFLYLIYQFPIFGILIGFIGIIRLLNREKKTAIFLLMIILVNGLFFIKTTSWQSLGGTKYTFYLSDYIVFSIFLGYGSDILFKWADKIIDRTKLMTGTLKIKYIFDMFVIVLFLSLTILFYHTMPYIVDRSNIDLLHARHLKYRDNERFFLNPNKKGYYGDRQLGEEMLKLAKKDSIIFADYTIYAILNYLKTIENRRPDIHLLYSGSNMELIKEFDKIKKKNPEISIYLADMNHYYNLKGIEGKYSVKPIGPFYKIY